MNKKNLYDLDLSEALWVKSARSEQSNGGCVEVTDLVIDGAVVGKAVRDSKNPEFPPLRYDNAEWANFTSDVSNGQQNLL